MPGCMRTVVRPLALQWTLVRWRAWNTEPDLLIGSVTVFDGSKRELRERETARPSPGDQLGTAVDDR